MTHPQKWRETADPWALPYRNFALTEVLGYPHAGNDVFQARGLWRGREVEIYIKIARQEGANLLNEVETIAALNWPLAPEVLDWGSAPVPFAVTRAMPGERLSAIVGDNRTCASMAYLEEYGRTLAQLHAVPLDRPPVRDRRFFHLPGEEYFERLDLTFVHRHLAGQKPAPAARCFCHGDFHYANVLWADGHLSAILDFELSGTGEREFDLAWALALRPGQRFLNTSAEIERFLQGYSACGSYDPAALRDRLALIYSRFYGFSGNEPEYLADVRRALHELCA